MKRKAAHHRGTYPRRARAVVAAAKRDPGTTCWRCGRTLAQHAPHRDGRSPFWTAGHVIDGDVSSPLAPEVSTCNFQAGAVLRNTGRTPGRNEHARRIA